MSATTKHKLEFVHAMGRHTRATVRQCEALMRYAGTLQRLAVQECNVGLTENETDKRNRLEEKVTALCLEFTLEPNLRWKLLSADQKKIKCQCGESAKFGRTVDGGAPYFYECTRCWPYTPVFSGDPRGCRSTTKGSASDARSAVLKIRVPDGFSDCGDGEGIGVPA